MDLVNPSKAMKISDNNFLIYFISQYVQLLHVHTRTSKLFYEQVHFNIYRRLLYYYIEPLVPSAPASSPLQLPNQPSNDRNTSATSTTSSLAAVAMTTVNINTDSSHV